MLGYNSNLDLRFWVTEESTWDYVLDIQVGLLTYSLTDIPDLEAASKKGELRSAPRPQQNRTACWRQNSIPEEALPVYFGRGKSVSFTVFR